MSPVARRGLLAAATLPLAYAAATSSAAAQAATPTWRPDRPLRLIVPFNAGGITDVMSRAVAQALTPVLGENVVVDNRPGANGSIGAVAAARAAGDGLTLIMGITDTHAINPSSFRRLPYDPARDFAPVTMVARVPFAVMVGPTMRGKADFANLVAEAKRERGRYSFATWGYGSSSHLAMERIARHYEFEKLHVPFTGQAPGMQAVAAGNVDAMVLPAGGAESLARDGRTRILAVLAPERLPLIPNVPTLKELGMDFTSGLWLALYVPAGTPPAAIATLNAAVRRAMEDEQLIATFRNQAAVPEPSTPEQLASFTTAEREAWGAVVRAANIVVE